MEFSRLGCLVRDSLVDQSIMLTHLCLMQGEKIEAWFAYFGVEFTAFLSAKKFTKNLSAGGKIRLTAKYVFLRKWGYQNSCSFQ